MLIAATAEIPTPFVAIDRAVMADNISSMQTRCSDAGVSLRPHIKTHKASAIARSQLAAGATGVTCATLSEAVVLGEAGCPTDVLISTPVFLDMAKVALLERAVALHPHVTLTADSDEILGAVLDRAPDSVGVMVELDSGLDRTGLPAGPGIDLARAAGGRLLGFSTHGGHSYRPRNAESAAADERNILAAVASEFPAARLSAGSTPTARHALGRPVTELRPGTYVFGDRQQVLLEAVQPNQVAAGVVSTVIHRSSDKFVVDAGAKSLSKDRAPWIVGYGYVVGRDEAQIEHLNDNHGWGHGARSLAVGDRVIVVPNHICPVVNLFDEVWIVGDDVDRIAVDLRGRQA